MIEHFLRILGSATLIQAQFEDNSRLGPRPVVFS